MEKERAPVCWTADSQTVYMPLTQLNIYTSAGEERDTGGRDFTCPTALETRILGSEMS